MKKKHRRHVTDTGSSDAVNFSYQLRRSLAESRVIRDELFNADMCSTSITPQKYSIRGPCSGPQLPDIPCLSEGGSGSAARLCPAGVDSGLGGSSVRTAEPRSAMRCRPDFPALHPRAGRCPTSNVTLSVLEVEGIGDEALLVWQFSVTSLSREVGMSRFCAVQRSLFPFTVNEAVWSALRPGAMIQRCRQRLVQSGVSRLAG